MRWLDSITDSMEMNLSKLQETLEDRGDGRAAIHGVTKSWTVLSPVGQGLVGHGLLNNNHR